MACRTQVSIRYDHTLIVLSIPASNRQFSLVASSAVAGEFLCVYMYAKITYAGLQNFASPEEDVHPQIEATDVASLVSVKEERDLQVIY